MVPSQLAGELSSEDRFVTVELGLLAAGLWGGEASVKASGIAGKVVVVTGAARGIGAELARRLASRGATIALAGLEPGELAQVAADCGRYASWHEVDVTDEAALAAAASDIVARHDRVDVVVANAGIAIGGPFAHTQASAFRRVIEVNLLGSVGTARAFLPALLDSRGYLLQVASLAAMTPTPMMTAYCTSKSGVEAFAHCLRAEVAHRGVGVGVAYLSWTDTDMVRGAESVDVLREGRARLPFPANRVNPLGPAVDALARGIERRASHVYGQRWLPPVQLVRGLWPGMAARVAARYHGDMEAKWLASGAAAVPAGAGGAADSAAVQAGA
jgi:NAD(P)-dependent dehydrogenase (short-subunit alcohol dehydrogenase family)